MRNFTSWVVLSCFVAGCPSSSAPDTGVDAPSLDAALDTPSALDAPIDGGGSIDAPLDTPDSALALDGGGQDAFVLADAPGLCDGLAGAACLGTAGCVPRFDDSCCPTCTPGACADCINPNYDACLPASASPCGTSSCGTAPDWACDLALPADCSTARVVDVDSCSVTGCVPAFPSGMGAPVLDDATCTPMLANSCTVSCRRIAPPCPTGTTPEGDGFCYTDRCIPTFVCLLEG